MTTHYEEYCKTSSYMSLSNLMNFIESDFSLEMIYYIRYFLHTMEQLNWLRYTCYDLSVSEKYPSFKIEDKSYDATGKETDCLSDIFLNCVYQYNWVQNRSAMNEYFDMYLEGKWQSRKSWKCPNFSYPHHVSNFKHFLENLFLLNKM